MRRLHMVGLARELLQKSKEALNTRPAAPVGGLETKAHMLDDGRLILVGFYDPSFAKKHTSEELVTRTQAEAIIAAERAKKEKANARVEFLLKQISKAAEERKALEAENAALTARVEELEETVRDDINFVKALETKLSMLTEQLKKVVAAWESLPGGRNYSIQVMQEWISGPMKKAIDNVRAALEAKP